MTAPNNPLPPLPPGATPIVVGSIRQAARATDIDFGLLMAQAQQESGFQADAKASGSSATGLFQFIDSTWLGLVRQFGDKYGAGALAQQITTDGAGRATVADPATRQKILDLRKDPRLAAALAAEYARLNKGALEQALGRKAGNADLYLAHFLGAGGATTFLKAVSSAGTTAAADLLPDAAAANRAVFYDTGTGRPRSVAEIYQSFTSKITADAQRLTRASAPAGLPTASADRSSFIRNLSFDGHRLTPSMAAMLNVFAMSALKLLGDEPSPTSSSPLLMPSHFTGHRSI
jgi:hypothetical protein